MQLFLLDSAADASGYLHLLQQLYDHTQQWDCSAQLQRQMDNGYHLLAAKSVDDIVAVCGFRLCESLARGKHLYIEDLVTDEVLRSHGHGEALLDWVIEYALQHGCTSIELDSKITHDDAQRFYYNQRMSVNAFHFSLPLRPTI